jgi:hypothetical protein
MTADTASFCKKKLEDASLIWTLDQYFPASYERATWKRLAPFFHLPGLVRREQDTVSVELRPFNDR